MQSTNIEKVSWVPRRSRVPVQDSYISPLLRIMIVNVIGSTRITACNALDKSHYPQMKYGYVPPILDRELAVSGQLY